MNHSDRAAGARKTGIYGAIATIIGIAVSGPIGLAIVSAIHSSGPWQGAHLYARHYHPVQSIPFFGGFLLVGGCMAMMAATYLLAEPRFMARALTAMMFTTAFASFIFFNYVAQTTFVPALATWYRPEYDAAITTLSLANPASLCWAIEMWGYALLGVATWLVAPVFNRGRLERATAMLMVANGVISIVGGIVTAYDLDWVFSTAGLASYTAWNVLFLALAICFMVSLRRHELDTLAALRRRLKGE